MNRNSAPRVCHGRALSRNNRKLTGNCYLTPAAPGFRHLEVIRQRPGPGYRHLLSGADINSFVRLLPDWEELVHDLNAVVLAPGDPDAFGFQVPGMIHLCAWPRDLWIDLSADGFEQEREHLERLDVPWERRNGRITCRFTEGTARAHQLLATFLHELGHHHDQITTRSRVQACRGEPYAFAYEKKSSALIWKRYLDTFRLD